MASNITVGTQQYGEIEAARGISLRTSEVGSVTQDPFSPVEAGNDSAKSKYTTTASSGAEIPG